QADSFIAVEGGRTQFRRFDLLAAGHESLGKRRALIREMRLVSDDGDRFFVAFRAKRDGRLETRLSSPHDNHAARHFTGHRSHCWVGGVWTIKPSNSSLTSIWQLKR